MSELDRAVLLSLQCEPENWRLSNERFLENGEIRLVRQVKDDRWRLSLRSERGPIGYVTFGWLMQLRLNWFVRGIKRGRVNA